MKPVSNGAKAVFAVAFALFLAVVLVGIALSDNPVKKFFKQQEVLDIAKMHMSQVKSGEVYTGALQFADDIDFDNLALIESDAQAFEPLAASYRMPKATPEEAAAKQAALQLALGPACDVPLIIMRTCAEVIDHADFLAHNGSKLAVSDAGAAAVLAQAAVVAASMNVYINAASMDDEARADRYRAEADRLIAEANERADGILAYTMDAIR